LANVVWRMLNDKGS